MFLTQIYRFLVLPSQVTDFEDRYLRKMNRMAALFFLLHVPGMVLLAFVNDTDPLLALTLSSAVATGPIVAMGLLGSRRAVSVVLGFTMMFMCGLLIHFGQGPVQIEMHFYFFVALGLLSIFGNPMVILAATATVAAHHTILFYYLPESVFNYQPSLMVLITHIVFALFGCVTSCFLARTHFNNVIGLERIIEQRTGELKSRHRDMRLILNSVEEGFLTIDSSGYISDERSAAVNELLGVVGQGENLIDVLRRHDLHTSDWFALALEEVFAGILPVEVCIDQLPKKLTAFGQRLRLRYCPIESPSGVTEKLMVVVVNITAEVEREKLQANNHEVLTMLERINHDRNGFLEFFDEAGRIIETLTTKGPDDLALVKREIHTLKGNAAVLGLQRLADACHALEDDMAETDRFPRARIWTDFLGCWSTVRGNLKRLLIDNRGELSLTNEQYNLLLDGLLTQKPVEILAPAVAQWKLEATRNRLGRISKQAKRLATRLGKGEIKVEIRDHGLQTESQSWGRFWSALIHAIRNAIDHGLESGEDRLLAGKPEFGKLALETRCLNDRFIVSVADDGRGIAWKDIANRARTAGMPNETHEDLVCALFADGVSTANEITAYSGRGTGMATLQQACHQMGGTVEVASTKGKGTTLSFSFPITKMAPRMVSRFAEHGIDNHLLVSITNEQATNPNEILN